MGEPLTFRPEAVMVKIGAKQKIIQLDDLTYSQHKELLKEVSKILIEKDTIPTAVGQIERSIQYQMLKENKTAEEAMHLFISKLSELYEGLTADRVVDLLKLATAGKITDEDIADMGGTEMSELLMFIISRQFKALKNLYASLGNILNPENQQGQSRK